MKIYTRTGDDGETNLFAGDRVRKNDPRVEAYGTVDELNSYIGLIRAHPLPPDGDAWLEDVQNTLFIIGADLATPLDAQSSATVRLQATAIKMLEAAIDMMEQHLPPLKAFILPGGAQAAAHTHVARTICRRTERLCFALAENHPINESIPVYLNRLSDFLFVLARYINKAVGEPELKWSVRMKN